MAIPIAHEGDEVLREWFGIMEVCHFCQVKTRYWHEFTNNPVCPSCAKTHKVTELPDWGKVIRAEKRKANKEPRQLPQYEPRLGSATCTIP
jgi:hypothetical protein